MNTGAERQAAAEIIAAVQEIEGENDGTFGESLALVEVGRLLGDIGGTMRYGADLVAELRLSVRLRRTQRRGELAAIVDVLAGVSEPPWPAIREALVLLLNHSDAPWSS